MKQATEEQKEKARQRRQEFRELCRSISAMTEEERRHLADRMPAGVVNPAGRAFSLINQCLLVSQAGTKVLTICGGFKQWLGAGRCVRKGEHGMAIWFPTEKKVKAVDDGGQQEEEGEDKPGFLMGTVFDISQTEELPAK